MLRELPERNQSALLYDTKTRIALPDAEERHACEATTFTHENNYSRMETSLENTLYPNIGMSSVVIPDCDPAAYC